MHFGTWWAHIEELLDLVECLDQSGKFFRNLQVQPCLICAGTGLAPGHIFP